MRDFSDKYLKFLTGPLSGINLTRITNEDEFYHKQILDSLVVLDDSLRFPEILNQLELLVDVGFGGGLPILPLAHNVPHGTFIGLEARKKKVSAVEQVRDHLSLPNVQLYHQRLEDVLFDRECIITMKAVGKISDMLSLITTKVQVYVYFYKGPNWKELEDLGPIGPEWELFDVNDFDLKYTDGRTILGFRNKKVPHGTINNKKLVKLSKFI
ncbi:MAG: class I SAM-dependent methyltransferase [Bacteriovoracaceae bacterium]|nr:class I SAM-dependent methyltransferase [Bacteriovoracaceae bacterium]